MPRAYGFILQEHPAPTRRPSTRAEVGTSMGAMTWAVPNASESLGRANESSLQLAPTLATYPQQQICDLYDLWTLKIQVWWNFHTGLWKWTECAVYCNHWSIDTIETQLSGLYVPHFLPYWGNEAKPVRWKMNSTPAARVCRLGASGWVSSKTRRPQVIIQMGHSAWEKNVWNTHKWFLSEVNGWLNRQKKYGKLEISWPATHMSDFSDLSKNHMWV